MSLPFRISHLAELDLEQIWLYTFDNWSQRQADKYYKTLIHAIEEICNHPELGKNLDHIKKGHRMLQVKSYTVIYKVSNETIWIDRILHKSMDIEIQLK